MRSRQATISKPVSCEGVGLHSGAPVRLTMRPALPGTGIVFERLDVSSGRVPARFDNVVDTRLGTTIANRQGVKIATVEHVMSALAGLEVDNAVIELTAGEVPIMDGSAAPFVGLVERAGIEEQAAPRRMLRIRRPVVVRDGDKLAMLAPADAPAFECEIAFASRAVGRQHRYFSGTSRDYVALLAEARTFGFAEEIDLLRASGLARGGSLDNAVVLEGDAVLNPEGLRTPDEFVRHKILDAIGDLALAGGPILGHFRSVRGGHALNNRLLRTLFACSDAFDWTEPGHAREPAFAGARTAPVAALA
ncbi:MAG: UDP-3-O-acyl-N-acetylglucosamine deacetylase [Alphaproteobacteria bacterium]|nr:UDP-3-O-acyl-N-acetylglucosamine deacetylase [Alphaproteobacteria bacterium]